MALSVKELKSNAVERRNFLTPSLKLDDQKFEFIFVLDRSGSMQGPRIELAKKALAIFLKSLPTTCIFNVFGFGSSFEKLNSSSVPYDERNVSYAMNHAQNIGANLGGTSLHHPMQDIYNSYQTPGYLTQIFVLTDGQTSGGPARIIDIIKANKTFARVFSLGIGSGACAALINGMAQVGGGVPEFVQHDAEIQTKVLNQLKIALKPSLLKPVRVI